MIIRDGLVLRTVGSDHVIVAEGLDALDLRCMVQVNDAVALLWNKAKETGEFTAEDLVKALCEAYDVSVDQATHDVDELMEQWKKIGIIG